MTVLIVPDGASEPAGPRATSLERARTPAIDALCRAGAVVPVRTIAPGVPPGSETGIPALLGFAPAGAVGRGPLEAAAAGLRLGPGERAWRCDVRTPEGARAGAEAVRAALVRLREQLPAHRVSHLRGHRLLVVGRSRPDLAGDPALSLWPEGASLPVVLGPDTVMVAAAGAAAGCARLMGAGVVIPAGATGGPDTDLRAKARAAVAAVAGGCRRVVVHVGAPDEAAHARDARAKVCALERIDRQVVAPLARAVAARGGRIALCPDHGCDPRTGRHDAGPVPGLVAGPGVAPAGPPRLTERGVAGLAVRPPAWLGLADAA